MENRENQEKVMKNDEYVLDKQQQSDCAVFFSKNPVKISEKGV